MSRVIILLVFLCDVFALQAQYFSVFDLDTKDYPVVRAKYFYMDQSGDLMDHLNKDLFMISEYGREADLLSLDAPGKISPRKLSVVLAFDVSSSMDQERLEIARSAGLKFIDLLPLEVSECAVSSFDHMNYLNCDFTHSEAPLRKAVTALHPRGGTSYNAGFITPYAGAVQIAKAGKYKKVIILLTDGLGEGRKQDIIRQATHHDISIYTVAVGLKMPEILKDVASATGGRYFEQVTDSAEAKAIYQHILLNAQSYIPGQVTWRSPNGCRNDIQTAFSYRGDTVVFRYEISDKQRAKLNVSPLLIQFDSINAQLTKEIKIEAVNTDFVIDDIKFGNPKSFSVQYPQTLPFNLKEGTSKRLHLQYDPDGADPHLTNLIITNNLCPDAYVYVKGAGASSSATLKLVTPNGGEVYSAGMSEKMKWKGIGLMDTVSVELSADGGANWRNIGLASGLEHEWMIPAMPGINNLISIEHVINPSATSGINQLFSLEGKGYNAHNARFVGNGRYVLTAEDNHSLKLWDGHTGQFIRSYPFHTEWIYDVSESPDGERIVTSSDDGSAIVFYLKGNPRPKNLAVNYSGINKAVFSNDGEKVITCGDDGAVRIWNSYTGRHLYGIMAHPGWVLDVDVSPNGNTIASAGDDGVIRIWRLDRHKPHRSIHKVSLTNHHDWVTDVEFSPDGKKLLSASKDRTVRLWDVDKERLLHTFKHHSKRVYSATFSPDGKSILTASPDGTVQVLNTSTRKVMDQIRSDKNQWFRRAFFGPQGDRIITISNKRKVKVWILNRKESLQKDQSDRAFRIVSPKPTLHPVDVGSHWIGQSKDTLVKDFFFNPADYPIKIKSNFIAGPNKAMFSLVSGYQSFTLAPNSSKDIELNFNPAEAGDLKAYIGVVTPTDTIRASLSGRGLRKSYHLPVEVLNFGRLDVGKTRDSTFILIQNKGNTPLEISRLKIHDQDKKPFCVGEPLVNTHIQPFESQSIRIIFQPLSGGRKSAQLSFYAEDHVQRIQLFGQGMAPRKVHLNGKVLQHSDHQPLSARVQCFDLESNHKFQEMVSNTKGIFELTLNPGRKYRIIGNKEGYVPSSIHLDLTGPIDSSNIHRNLHLSLIDSGSTVVLNNIFFTYNSAQLTDNSRGELEQLSKFLKKNPEITFLITGHTDSIGTQKGNLLLSRERARSVMNFFIATGISADRITIRGLGESQPIADNATVQGRRKNRRVEFTITGRSGHSGR